MRDEDRWKALRELYYICQRWLGGAFLVQTLQRKGIETRERVRLKGLHYRNAKVPSASSSLKYFR